MTPTAGCGDAAVALPRRGLLQANRGSRACARPNINGDSRRRHRAEIKILRRVVLHAINASPARWRGGAGSLFEARNDVKRYRSRASTLVDIHTGAHGALANVQ